MEISSSIRSYFIDLLLLISPLLTTAAISDDNQLRASSCSGKQTHPGSHFYLSRMFVMTILAKYTPSLPNHGFALASSAKTPKDRAYGLALCRGDISYGNKLHHHCKNCLAKAIANINCTHTRDSIIWYDHCLLKLSDQNFFGQIDTDNNDNTCSGNPASNTFSDKTKGLLKKLARELAVGQKSDPTMFASGNEKYWGQYFVYAMVQCTRDLNVKNCADCLQQAIRVISTDCLPKTSGSLFYGSCVVRYDNSPFLL